MENDAHERFVNFPSTSVESGKSIMRPNDRIHYGTLASPRFSFRFGSVNQGSASQPKTSPTETFIGTPRNEIPDFGSPSFVNCYRRSGTPRFWSRFVPTRGAIRQTAMTPLPLVGGQSRRRYPSVAYRPLRGIRAIRALINKKTGPPQGSTLALEWCVRGHLQWPTVSSVVAWIEISSRSPLGVGSLIHKPANRGHSEDVKSGTPNTFC